MANKIGLFALNPAPNDFVTVIEEIAHDTAPADAFIGKYGRKDFADWSCFVVEDGNYAYAAQWCQAITAKTGGLGVSVFVFEANWDFNVFHAGQHVAGREAYTTPDPVLLGDLDAAAALLNVPRDIFSKYCVSPVAGLAEKQLADEGLVDDLFDKYEGYKSYENDEYEPWDEWGFCDFVKKIGFDYPNPDERTKVELGLEVASARTDWNELPPLLGEADVVFRATPPLVGKPWWRFW